MQKLRHGKDPHRYAELWIWEIMEKLYAVQGVTLVSFLTGMQNQGLGNHGKAGW
jgi:hypothetical protein